MAAAAAKSLQSCPTLWDPVGCSPSGSAVPGILQARVLEWVAISFSSAWKWKVVSNSWQPHGLRPTRLLHPWDFPGKSTGVGCHCLLLLRGRGFPFGVTKCYGTRQRWWLHNTVIAWNTSELLTLKWLILCYRNFMYVFRKPRNCWVQENPCAIKFQ